MPKLLDCFQDILAQVGQYNVEQLPIYLAGKSMGSRVAATLLKSSPQKANGCIAYGYPFHPQRKADKLRLEPLQGINTPTLIVQGERDLLGSKSECNDYDLADCVSIHFVEDGDHDLKPRVRSGFTHEQHVDTAARLTREFINEINSKC